MRRTIAQSALVFTSVLLIMALAGCGGSSKKTAGTGDNGDGMMPVEPPVAPTPEPAAITGLPSGHTLATGTVNAGADPVVVFNSKGKRSVLTCPSGGEACAITVAADRSATSTGGTPTVATTTDEMLWQANNGPDGTTDGAHAVGLGKRLIVGTTLNEVFTANPAAGGNSEVAQSTLATPPDVTTTLEWTNTARPKLGLTLGSTAFTALDVSGDTNDPGELEADSGSATPSLGTGWNGASFSGSFLGKTMRATVYTSAAKPDGYMAGTAKRPVATGLDLVGEAALIAAFGATAPTSEVEFGISSSIGADVKVKIPATAFATPRQGGILSAIQNVKVTYTDSDGDEQTRDVTMRCVSDTCRGVTGSNPRLVGSWDIEVPAVPATAGTQDPFTVTLGSWLVLPKTPGDATQFNMGVFADTENVAATTIGRTQLENLTGTATFTGRATGLYMNGEYSGRGASRALASAEVSSFTADVSLVADFGTASAFTGVTGSVSSFMDTKLMDDGDAIPLDWRMTLQNTADDGDVLQSGPTILETGAGQSATGTWGVQFAWDGVRAGQALGTFSASTAVTVDNALHVVGAFGANIE